MVLEMSRDKKKKKDEIRKVILAERDGLGRVREAYSERIGRYVQELEVWKKASGVAMYVNARSEVITEGLIRAAWESGKKVFLPRCLTAGAKKDAMPGEGGGIMEMVLCRSWEDLEPARFGLLEPRKACPGLPFPEQGSHEVVRGLPDLILVPAVGIDLRGVRVGYGGGFYDRLLSRPGWDTIPRLGLAFSKQIVQELPCDQGDVRLHGFVTEEGCVWI